MIPHPIGSFLSAPDVHLEMLLLSAGYTFPEPGLYEQAKAVALQVDTEHTPTIPLLVEAWRGIPALRDFADAVDTSYVRLMACGFGRAIFKGRLPTLDGVQSTTK
jgi:hypothetical protein